MTRALTVGVFTSIPLTASGGTKPYIYSIISGLPAGLTLNASTGVISGTPTTAQASTAIAWQVEDDVAATATDSFNVVVQSVPVAVPHYRFLVELAGLFRLRGALAVANLPIELDGDTAFSTATVADAVLFISLALDGDAGFSTATVADAVLVASGSALLDGDTAFSTATVADAVLTGGVLDLDGATAFSTATVADATIDFSLEPETVTLLAAFSGSYDGARQTNINNLIKGLKDDGDWSKFAALYIVGANTADSFINWKAPGTFDATNNGLVVTAFTQYQGNGTSQYADTGINPNTHLSTNNCGLIVGQLTNTTSGKIAIGATNGTQAVWFAGRNAGDQVSVRINQSSSSVILGGVTDGSGIWVASRTGSSSLFLRRNGVDAGLPIISSSSNPNFNLYLSARNNSGSAAEHSPDPYWMFAILSTGPTIAEADDIRSRLATYQATL